MGDLSEHFSRKEFACKCGCGADTVDAELITILEEIRTEFNKPVTITSGSRCKYHNGMEGGGNRSQHLLGRAADIKVKGVDASVIYRYLSTVYPDTLGLGKYDTFTHIDTRNGQARW